jgi:hypothetical protein
VVRFVNAESGEYILFNVQVDVGEPEVVDTVTVSEEDRAETYISGTLCMGTRFSWGCGRPCHGEENREGGQIERCFVRRSRFSSVSTGKRRICHAERRSDHPHD